MSYYILLIGLCDILLHITYYCLASYYCLACASHITFHVTHHHVIGSIEKGTYQAVICNMECTSINCHLSYENLKADWLLHRKMCLSGGNCVHDMQCEMYIHM